MRTNDRNGKMTTNQNLIHTSLRGFVFVAAIFAACSGGQAQGIMSRWAIVQDLRGGVGYDSNLYGSGTDEIDDGLFAARYGLNVSRKNSLARVVLDGNVNSTWYFSEGDADYVDGNVSLEIDYPDTPVDVSFWKGRLFWTKTTNINLDTGRRLQPTNYGAEISGEYLISPKLGFTGMLQAGQNDYSGDGLSTTDVLQGRLGVSYGWRPELRVSADYTIADGKSDGPNGTDATRHMAGLRLRGRLLPKVTGMAFVGARRVEFSGPGVDSEETKPTFDVDLKWESSPKFSTLLGINSDYRFSANGSLKSVTEIELRFNREFAPGFRGSLWVGPGFSDYELSGVTRDDQYWRFGGEFEYALTERFFAQISAGWTTNDSSDPDRDFDRAGVSFNTGIRF